MKLVSVANESFLPHAINLFLSYDSFHNSDKKVLYYFNTNLDKLEFAKKIVKNLEIIEIPKINDYMYNTKIFLFKAYALAQEIIKKEDFIYSDSANVYVRKDDFLESHLEAHDRLLLEYPEEIKKNKFFTTKRCFKLLGCDTEYYKDKKQYWAGLQAYKYTKENELLLTSQFDYMQDKNISFPESTVERPDGSSSECWFHRNDQSVLSLLVEKYGLAQPFDHETFNRYGDFYTVFEHDLSYRKQYDENKMIIHARQGRKFGLSYFNKEMSDQYARL